MYSAMDRPKISSDGRRQRASAVSFAASTTPSAVKSQIDSRVAFRIPRSVASSTGSASAPSMRAGASRAAREVTSSPVPPSIGTGSMAPSQYVSLPFTICA